MCSDRLRGNSGTLSDSKSPYPKIKSIQRVQGGWLFSVSVWTPWTLLYTTLRVCVCPVPKFSWIGGTTIRTGGSYGLYLVLPFFQDWVEYRATNEKCGTYEMQLKIGIILSSCVPLAADVYIQCATAEVCGMWLSWNAQTHRALAAD